MSRNLCEELSEHEPRYTCMDCDAEFEYGGDSDEPISCPQCYSNDVVPWEDEC